MIALIKGIVIDLKPTHVLMQPDGLGIGYKVNISLVTYESIKNSGLYNIALCTYLSIKENEHSLYGFYTPDEHDMFVMLIGISGVGTNTARTVLSYLETRDLINFIVSGDEKAIVAIKGIGPKTAKTIILELQDKLKAKATTTGHLRNDGAIDTAVSALIALGFPKTAKKTVESVSIANPDITLEDLIKQSMKILK